MEKSELSISIQGVRGGNIKEFPKLGFTCNFVGDNNKIVFDAFVGFGDSYKRREQTRIQIIQGDEMLFQGTFDELANILKSQAVK